MTVESVKNKAREQGQGAAPPPSGDNKVTVIEPFPKMLQLYKKEVERALPEHLHHNVDRYMRLALSEFRQQPALARCDPRSIFASVILCSQMGWELGGVLGHAYLVPYKDECQLIPGWRGLVDLVLRSGQGVVWTGVIFKDQKYEFLDGSERYVRVLNETKLDAPEDITHAYAVGRIRGLDWPVVDLWPVAKLVKHRDRFNKVGNGHYSYKNWEMYARKVPLLQVLKYMPMKTDMAAALTLDERYESGEPQRLTIEAAADISDGLNFPTGGEQPTGQANETKPEEATTEASPQITKEKAGTEEAKPAESKASTAKAKSKEGSEAKPKDAAAEAAPKKAPPPWAAQKDETASTAAVDTTAVVKDVAPAEDKKAAAENKPVEESKPAEKPKEPKATTTTPAKTEGKKPIVIRKVTFPAELRKTSDQDGFTTEQYKAAKAEADRLNVNLENTIADWLKRQTGEDFDISELSGATMQCFITVLTAYGR